MKRSLFRVLAAVAIVAGVVAGPGAALPASADPDVAACTVNGGFTYAPGVGAVPAAQVVGGNLFLTCTGLDDGGLYALPFAGGSLENCLAGTGTVFWGPGATSPEGPVVGGGFSYYRVGFHTMEIVGTIPVPAVFETHNFVAHVGWVPAGICLPPALAANVVGVGTVSDL